MIPSTEIIPSRALELAARGVKFGRKKKLAPARIAKARKLIEAGERVEVVS
jgi:hypothetical protein